MEKKYPQIFDKLANMSTDERAFSLMLLNVPDENRIKILALLAWRKNKIIFNFDDEVSNEITTMTHAPDKNLPSSELQHLPYPSFAVKTVPFSVLDPQTDKVKAAFTGNAFVWLDNGTLNTTWEKADGSLQSALIEFGNDKTI